MLYVIPPAVLLLLNACIAFALRERVGKGPHGKLAIACAVTPAVYGLGSVLFLRLGEWVGFAAFAGLAIVAIPVLVAMTVVTGRQGRAFLVGLGALEWLYLWVPRAGNLPFFTARAVELSQASFLAIASLVALVGLRQRKEESGLERRLLAGSIPFFAAGAFGLLLKPAWAKVGIFPTAVLLADEVVLLILAAEQGALKEPKAGWRSLAAQTVLLGTGALLLITGAINVGLFPRDSGAVAVAVAVSTGMALAYGIARPSLDLLVRNALWPEAQRSAERIKALRSELDLARERLREAEHLSIVGQLAVEVAHEIKNPLGPIRGYAKIIERELEERGALTEVVARGIAVIRQEVEAIDARSRGLLELGRPKEPILAPIDYASLVEDAVDLVRADCPSSVRIGWRSQPGSLPGTSDPVLLRSALSNVLVNAVQAIEQTGRAGSIALELVTRDGNKLLLVDDDGPGLPEGGASELFRPFASKKKGGHGLGLVIARGAMRSLGGDLELEPREGGGTRARFVLEGAAMTTAPTPTLPREAGEGEGKKEALPGAGEGESTPVALESKAAT